MGQIFLLQKKWILRCVHVHFLLVSMLIWKQLLNIYLFKCCSMFVYYFKKIKISHKIHDLFLNAQDSLYFPWDLPEKYSSPKPRTTPTRAAMSGALECWSVLVTCSLLRTAFTMYPARISLCRRWHSAQDWTGAFLPLAKFLGLRWIQRQHY